MCPKLKETKKKREQNATCVPGLKHEPEEGEQGKWTKFNNTYRLKNSIISILIF